MAVYNAPLNDMRFILTDVFKAHEFGKITKTLLMLTWKPSI